MAKISNVGADWISSKLVDMADLYCYPCRLDAKFAGPSKILAIDKIGKSLHRLMIGDDSSFMGVAIVELLNLRTEITRQLWFVDDTGRLDYHHLVDSCNICGCPLLSPPALYRDSGLCVECGSRAVKNV